MIQLTEKEKEKLILKFEDYIPICLAEMLEEIKEDNENLNKLYDVLDKYCEENRLNEKSCTKCFKTFFNLFTEEKEIIF